MASLNCNLNHFFTEIEGNKFHGMEIEQKIFFWSLFLVYVLYNIHSLLSFNFLILLYSCTEESSR